MSTKTMRIIRFAVIDFMRVFDVEITPAGDVIEITGKNGAGKTSLLRALWTAVGGLDQAPEIPIRQAKEGEEQPDRATITVDLGTDGETRLSLTRTFTEKGSTLAIRTPEGAKFEKPQALLEKLIGSLSMDPLAFLKEPKKQAETLRRLVGLDTSALDSEHKRLFEERTGVNRDVAMRQGEVEGIVLLEAPEPIDVSALLVEQQNATRLERDERERVAAAHHADEAWGDATSSEEEAKRRLSAAEDAYAVAQARRKEAKATAEALKLVAPITVPDLDAIYSRIAAAGEINARVAQAEATAKQKARAENLLREATSKADAMTARLNAIKSERSRLIAECKMPIAGLGIEDGVVLYNGLPLTQASDAEQLEVACAIAMAQNPQVRVIRIHEGSLLDDDAKDRLVEFAATHDLQVWMETVLSRSGPAPAAIVIEDGHIREPAAPEAEPVATAKPARKRKA